MNTREMSTVMKLLFFSFRLILATSQPSAQESVSTKTDIRSSCTTQPKTTCTDRPTVIQYTMMAGSSTMPEYIRPMR